MTSRPLKQHGVGGNLLPTPKLPSGCLRLKCSKVSESDHCYLCTCSYETVMCLS